MISKNHSYFFVPFKVQNINDWKERIEGKTFIRNNSPTKVWQRISDTVPVYLMKYMNDGVGYQTERHYAYQLVEKRAYSLPYTDGNRKLLTCIMHHKGQRKEYTIDIRIRIHCFGTNIGFLVYDIWYSNDMNYQDILTFNYLFKKVGTSKFEIFSESLPSSQENTICLYALSESLIANGLDNVEIFFHANHQIRMTSNVFSIFCDTAKKEIDDKLFHLSHSYTTDYGYNKSYHDDIFHRYHPYAYIHWGYCPDGIACVYYNINAFTNNDLHGRLQNDYYFMYLVLLNQKYTLLSLINEMMACKNASPQEWRHIQHKLIIYQMEYSFRIVSDEMTYHKIYSDMREILSINELEKDLMDISNRMFQLKNEEQSESEELANAKRSWRINLGLGMLSLLAVFSAFVDSTGTLDMWFSACGENCPPWLYIIVYGIIICVAIIVVKVLIVSYLQYRYGEKNKDKKGDKRNNETGLYETKQ